MTFWWLLSPTDDRSRPNDIQFCWWPLMTDLKEGNVVMVEWQWRDVSHWADKTRTAHCSEYALCYMYKQAYTIPRKRSAVDLLLRAINPQAKTTCTCTRICTNHSNMPSSYQEKKSLCLPSTVPSLSIIQKDTLDAYSSTVVAVTVILQSLQWYIGFLSFYFVLIMKCMYPFCQF